MYCKASIKTILLVASSVIVISCASSSKDIETIYVSPDQYRPLNCKSLAHELAQLNQRKNSLAVDLDKKAGNDQGITAVSAIIFWPAVFALGGNKEQEGEYAKIKGEYDAVAQVGVEKKCNLNMSPSLQIASIFSGSTPASPVLPIEYYGQAEEEIDTNSYDNNLWAQALVEAEGDETKRTARYIELRANQLYSEQAGAINPDSTASYSGLPPPAMQLRTSFAGNTFSGTTRDGLKFHVYHSSDGSMFGRSTTKFNKEDQDSGVWGINQDSQYCRKWNKWRAGSRDCFQVYSLENNKFRMKAIGKSYQSIFTIHQGDPEGLGGVVASMNSSPPIIYNFTGTYTSAIAYNQDVDRNSFRGHFGSRPNIVIGIQHKGDVITGVMSSDRLGEIEGLIKGNKIKFNYYMKVPGYSDREGHGIWMVGDDGSTLNGTWRGNSPYSSYAGKWNLTKIDSVAVKSEVEPTEEASSEDSVSVLEFYGEAESEINGNSYDKNLWARALVETEGDQTKRKARYIELRANQLYIENGGSLSAIGLY